MFLTLLFISKLNVVDNIESTYFTTMTSSRYMQGLSDIPSRWVLIVVLHLIEYKFSDDVEVEPQVGMEAPLSPGKFFLPPFSHIKAWEIKYQC